jgi:hypothetical protein
MPKAFYILSTGRCGTTFLSEMIALNDPGLGKLHQLPDSKWLNVRANIALANKRIRKTFVSSLSRKYDHVLPSSTTDPLRSLAYTFYLRHLADKHPKLKENIFIIHLVRDPRNFVSSFMNWKNRKLSGKIAHHLTPFWMPEPPMIKKCSMSKFEHFCWIWERKNRLFYEEFAWFQGYHRFKMEDLYPGSEKLQHLLQLLLEKEEVITQTDKHQFNSSKKNDFPNWDKWTPRQAKKLNTVCADLMLEFGYGDEIMWKEMIGDEK